MSTFRGLGLPRVTLLARGFTLVELMIAIVVAFILTALALPSFRDLILGNSITQNTNLLVHDLNLARSEAVNRGTLVAVISNSGGNDWSGGWKVVADSVFKNDGTFADAGDAILRVSPGVDASGNYSVRTKVTASASGSGIAPTDGLVVFTAQGNLIPKATSFDINVCRPDAQPAKSRRITVAASGAIVTALGTGGSPAPSC